MKILFLSSPPFADCDFPLIREFQRQGHDVTYLIDIFPFNKKSTLFDIKKLMPKDGIYPATCFPELKAYSSYMDLSKVYIVNHTMKQQRFPQNLLLTLKVISFIIKEHYDVVHTGIHGLWENLIYRCHPNVVLTIHDPFPHTGEASERRAKEYRGAMRAAKKFVLLNDKQKLKFIQAYNLKPEQVFVNHLGKYDCVEAFTKPNVKEKPHSILFFGRISPYKGIEYLCEAMVKVHAAVPDVTLTIAGGGKLYFDITPYQDLCYIKVINRYVDMQELTGLLQAHEVVAVPYTDATQSGVIQTAFSMDKLVVATNVGGIGEIVKDGNTGLLVPPRDADALADALIKMLTDEELKGKIKVNIPHVFDGKFSWEEIAKKYIEVYRSRI